MENISTNQNVTEEADDNKQCETCQQIKLLEDFNISKSGRKGHHNSCKECRREAGKKIDNPRPSPGTLVICNGSLCGGKELDESMFARCKRNANGLQKTCKKCRSVQQTKYKSTLEGFIIVLLASTRNNVRKYKNGNIAIEITTKDILDLYRKQDGKCAISGLPMTTEVSQEQSKHPYNISIDRIDSKLNYTVNNIQLVCNLINLMKLDYGMDAFYQACEDVVAYHEKSKT